MRGYSESNIFSAEECVLFRRATRMIEGLSKEDEGSVRDIRCHELARAAGRILGLEVQDGFYGFVDHSWLWTTPMPARTITPRLGFPNILDVYSVGSLPMVRLVACDAPSLPHVGWAYRPGHGPRDDIDERIVEMLVRAMRVIEDDFRRSLGWQEKPFDGPRRIPHGVPLPCPSCPAEEPKPISEQAMEDAARRIVGSEGERMRAEMQGRTNQRRG